jgi:hypothetical protein
VEIRCLSNIPLDTDEPVAAIRQFVKILKDCAVDTAQAEVTINLAGISARARATKAKIRPERTGGASFEQALGIVQELTNLGVAERSSVSFILSANNFRWKSSTPGTSASLLLLDGKAFQTKKRFELAATLGFEAGDVKDRAVASMIEKVAAATGIRFRAEHATVAFSADDARRATPTELLAVALGWNEVVEDVTQRAKAGISLSGFPHLMTSAESIEFRFDKNKLGKSVRVDFRRIVRKWLKDEFPDYEHLTGPWDGELLQKPLAEGLAAYLGVDKRPGAFSKQFNINIGIGLASPRFAPSADRPFRLIESVFRFFGIGPLPLCWTYFSEDDLREALNGAAILIKQVLAIFEPAVLVMRHAHQRPIESFAGPRELTAREAYELVLPKAKEWADDAGLIGIFANAVVAHAVNAFRAAVQYSMWGSAGRPGEAGGWTLKFHSRTKEKNLTVRVPSRGPISRLHGSAPRGRSWPSDFDHIMKEGWIDSDQACLAAQAEAFGKDLPSDLKFLQTAELSSRTNMLATSQIGPPFRDGMFKMDAAWRIRLSDPENRERSIFDVTVPAYGGPPTCEVRKFDRLGRPANS